MLNLEADDQICMVTFTEKELNDFREKFPAWRDADSFEIH
jgi:hypothetical protein